MNDWYQRMVDILQLNGKGERTQQAYTRSVRMLSQFCDKTPVLISEQEFQEYFLQRKNINHWSPKTMRICYCGFAFSTLTSLSAIGTSSQSRQPKRNIKKGEDIPYNSDNDIVSQLKPKPPPTRRPNIKRNISILVIIAATIPYASQFLFRKKRIPITTTVTTVIKYSQ